MTTKVTDTTPLVQALPPTANLKFPLGLVGPPIRPYLELMRMDKVNPPGRQIISSSHNQLYFTAYWHDSDVLALRYAQRSFPLSKYMLTFPFPSVGSHHGGLQDQFAAD